MIVTHIDGRSELLTDYKSLQRKRRVNGEYSLSFLLFKTERNEHSYTLAVEESLIDYDGQQYRIKKMSEKIIGNTPVKQIQADHIFFDLVDEYQYNTISGAKQLPVCIAHALESTGYTYAVVDSFPSVTFENFGDDNSLALIQTALNRFGAEVEINGKHLTFRRQIGRKTDIQFRYKHNIKTIELNVDSSNLSTYIRGYGKQNEDGSYVVTAEYLSPLHEFYGIRHAKPVYDERYTTYPGLLDRLQNDLQDVPEISITMEAVELKKAGFNTEQVELGDDVFTIYEPLNLDLNARIVEIIEFPEEPKSNQFTIANIRGSVVDSIADFQRTKDRIDGIFEGKEKLPFNVLDDAVQRATLALQSAQTELEFTNGIIARDPRDPNKLTSWTSIGFGISKNGGKTFDEAITADGFNLSAGAIGQLDANNIKVGGETTFENGYDPHVAQEMARLAQTLAASADGKATGASNQINLWKYPNTTMINGGALYNDSVTTNKLLAGVMTGFVIQTHLNSLMPRIYMGGAKFEASNANGKVSINPEGWNNDATIRFNSGSADFIISAYNNRAVMTSNGGELEIWALSGGVGIRGNLDVQGAKNASVPTSHGRVNVSAYETAEYYFGDIGRGQVANGECVIHIDSLFAETVNTDIQYEVFLTPYGPGQIYVEPDSLQSDRFTVKGDNIPFAYEIKAKRKGYEDVRLESTYESEVETVAY
ncbi:phage tail protein [Sporosarcina sp. Sa2YVA2]|uniref:Phage tail protein n=1 Tax=Sporosarcina quadrami TaxID=2762234 RepID=A0ABR8U8N6_9BACL|nr:phage tail protein [Sporosarcina quadrami]MBD7984399.1 phage tail protein [Sporosarcina quadrami]